MAMPELKQKMLISALAQIGYPEAAYNPATDRVNVQAGNDRMPVINSNGDIRYGIEYGNISMNTIRPLVDAVNESYAAWDNSKAMPFKDLKQFRILAALNNIMLAARDDTELGRGLHFVTWRYNQDQTGVDNGFYTEDYTAAKESFAIRSGLVSQNKLFTQEQAAEIKAAIEYCIENNGDMTIRTEDELKTAAAKLRAAYPEKETVKAEAREQKTAATERETTVEAIVQNHTTTAINGEIACFDTVISTEYPYLAGEVSAVDKLGTPEHDGISRTDNVFVDFQSDEYSESRVSEIEKHFSELHGEPKTMEDIAVDLFNVKTTPDKLLLISETEMRRVVRSPEDAALLVKHYLGDGEQQNFRRAELIARVDKNLADYHDSLMGFGQDELIEMAGKISAWTEAHDYMTNGYPFEEKEIDFYLQFQNPLEIIADAWDDRRIGVDEISFAMNHVFDHSDDYLGDYPLMGDMDVTADIGLRRYMDIDLNANLGKIAEKVLVNYSHDWRISEKALEYAASSQNPEDKRLILKISEQGISIAREREAFIMQTPDYTGLTNHSANDPGVFGYVVDVESTDGVTIKGNVFELGDYTEFAERLRSAATTLESVTIIRDGNYGDGVVNLPSSDYFAFRNDFNRNGEITDTIFLPFDKVKLAGVISNERSMRMKLPVGDPSELLQKVTDRLAVVRKPPEITEKAADKQKPKTLAAKMQAANEKVKAQDEQATPAKSRKREERD
jgi:hypothetical protein